MTVKDFVGLDPFGQQNTAKFEYYRAGFMFYLIPKRNEPRWFRFPIPLDDVGNGTLNYSDKALTFMRWIRKAIENGEMIEIDNEIENLISY